MLHAWAESSTPPPPSLPFFLHLPYFSVEGQTLGLTSTVTEPLATCSSWESASKAGTKQGLCSPPCSYGGDAEDLTTANLSPLFQIEGEEKQPYEHGDCIARRK